MLVRSIFATGMTAGAAIALSSAASAQEPRAAPVLGDIGMGMQDAPVTIVEYASITCAACQHFHTDVLPRLKAKYILTGEARFVLRDYPTTPAPIAFAGVALARCAGADEYYGVLNDLFARQTEILTAARSGGVQSYFLQIGAAHGMDQHAVESCIRDKKLQAAIETAVDQAPDIASPPAVFVNDHRVEGYTYEAISKVVDATLTALAAPPPPPPALEEAPLLTLPAPEAPSDGTPPQLQSQAQPQPQPTQPAIPVPSLASRP